jgi:hypothetical protein
VCLPGTQAKQPQIHSKEINLSDPTPTLGEPRKPLRIGKRMVEALDEIKSRPGVTDTVIERQFGRGIVSKLNRANLIDSRGASLHGRKLFPRQQVTPASVALENFTLRAQLPGETDAETLRHNLHAVVCPACKAGAGRLCVSLKTGREVRFPHHDRTDQLIKTLTELAFSKTQNS